MTVVLVNAVTDRDQWVTFGLQISKLMALDRYLETASYTTSRQN